MIDVTSCTRVAATKIVTRWGAPDCRRRHIVVSGRMCVLERGIQPAFSGKCAVQVNPISIIETFSMNSTEGKEMTKRRDWCWREPWSGCKLTQHVRAFCFTLTCRRTGFILRCVFCELQVGEIKMFCGCCGPNRLCPHVFVH